MHILRLSDTGYDRVALWTSKEKPEGMFLHYNGSPVCFAMAAMEYDDGVIEVGLFEMAEMALNLYNYIVQELQGRPVAEFDMMFISDHRQISMVAQQGGCARLPEEIQTDLTTLAGRVGDDNFHNEVREALVQPHRRPTMSRRSGA
jgi:hypothetical protein